MKKKNWQKVERVEDSGKGYDRVYVNGEMVATVEPDFVKVGDEIAVKYGRVYVIGK